MIPPNHAESRLPVPRHVAIIMDGNGRWAKQRGLPRLKGHRAGTENIRRITTKAAELGIEYLTFWAFSTDNWNRPPEEVEGILHILAETLPREREELHKEGARLRHIGSNEGLDPNLIAAIQDAIQLTSHNDRINLTLAFNYSGRNDILQAVQHLLRDGVDPSAVDEQLFSDYLFTVDIPDPDLIIRTSGEMRTSNFFLWQAAYSEWAFVPTLWPDFTEAHLEMTVEEYRNRERRFGGLLTGESFGSPER